MYDAIIVGARCAGSPTAMLLARMGYRVLLVDKAAVPSDAISTLLIWQPGVACLKRWGLLDAIIASNCPALTRMSVDFGTISLTGHLPPADGVAEAYAPRRTVLDKILVEAAVAAGAELRERFTVQEIIWDDDHVTGIRGRTTRGATVAEKARIVIGADGLYSTVARAVQAPTYHEKPRLTINYYGFWSGVPVDGFEVYLGDGCVTAGVPTQNGLTLIGVVWPYKRFRAFRADIDGNFLKTLEIAPVWAERVRGGRREERIRGSGDLPNFFRKPYGPGWALVGDAVYHKDPITAQGITDAFRGAERLAAAIDAGFSGRQPLDEALAGYEQQRNEEALPIYEFTCQCAALEPPAPDMRQFLEALRGNPQETDRYLGTFAGTTPAQEFFSPENRQRVIDAARRDHAGA
jgi:flavin-dependent dehydrogenase